MLKVPARKRKYLERHNPSLNLRRAYNCSPSLTNVLDRPIRKRPHKRHARKTPLGCRRPVPRQLRPQGPGILRPVLGLIFLRFAEVRFAAQRAKLEKASASSRRGSRVDEPAAYHAEGILYLAPNARFDFLLNLPEAANIGAKVNDAMRDIEKHNPQLAGVLPKTYNLFTSTLLKELLKKVSEIPATVDYDAFGRIYEYFLGEFARTEGSKGGESGQVELSTLELAGVKEGITSPN